MQDKARLVPATIRHASHDMQTGIQMVETDFRARAAPPGQLSTASNCRDSRILSDLYGAWHLLRGTYCTPSLRAERIPIEGFVKISNDLLGVINSLKLQKQ